MFVTVCFKWCDVLFPAFAAVAKLLSSLLMTIECTLVCLLDAKWLMIFVSCLSLFFMKWWSRPWNIKNQRKNALRTISFVFYVSLCGNSKLYSALVYIGGLLNDEWSWCTSLICVFNHFSKSIRRHRDEKEPKITKNSEKIWSSPKNCAVTALIIIKGTSGTFVFPFIFHMKPFF